MPCTIAFIKENKKQVLVLPVYEFVGSDMAVSRIDNS